MFTNFNKYICDFINVDDFNVIHTDDVGRVVNIATIEIDEVDSQGGVCYWDINILSPFIEDDNIPEIFTRKAIPW